MARVPSLQPAFHTPIAAPTLDTSPETLELPGTQSPPDQRDVTSRVKRISSAVEKTVEKTVDRLSRSVSGKSSTGQTTPPSSARRRMFSLSRKGKPRPLSGEIGGRDSRIFQAQPDPTHMDITPTPSTSAPNISLLTSSRPPTGHTDDSPFIVPPSPPLRPSLTPFRGDGSVCIFFDLSYSHSSIFFFVDACWDTNSDTSTPSLTLDGSRQRGRKLTS